VTRPRVTIYTDGACDPNPGPGGWSAILRFGSTEKILTGGERKTTNNRMELTAALRALETLTEPCQVEIYTDSEYLQRGFTEWMPNWKAKNWKRKGGKLANLDLWQALDAALVRHEVDWNWVRGHAGVRHNQRADALARKAILR
jgi:ribonuclease HI